MTQYLVSVYDQPESRNRTPEEMQPLFEAVGAVNQRAMEAGVFVFAGGLHDQSVSTTVDARGGTPVVTDGPYLETKEYLGGFWIIEAPDLDAALGWAKDMAVACQAPLDVRPFMAGPPEDVQE